LRDLRKYGEKRLKRLIFICLLVMKFRVDATLYSDGANKNSDADRILKCSRGVTFYACVAGFPPLAIIYCIPTFLNKILKLNEEQHKILLKQQIKRIFWLIHCGLSQLMEHLFTENPQYIHCHLFCCIVSQ